MDVAQRDVGELVRQSASSKTMSLLSVMRNSVGRSLPWTCDVGDSTVGKRGSKPDGLRISRSVRVKAGLEWRFFSSRLA